MKILLISLLLSSCTIVRYYKVKDIKKNYSKIESEAIKSDQKTKSNLIKMKNILEEIKIQNQPELTKLLPELTQSYNNCESERARFKTEADEIMRRFHLIKLTGNKVESTELEYQQVERLNKYTKDKLDQLQREFNTYKSTCQSFMDILKRNKINYLEVSKIQEHFDSSYNSFKSASSNIRSEIAKFRNKVSKLKHKNRGKILQETEKLSFYLVQINESTQRVNKTVQSFYKKYKNTPKTLHGPGSDTFIGVQKIRSEITNINKLVSKFNSTVADVNKLGEE